MNKNLSAFLIIILSLCSACTPSGENSQNTDTDHSTPEAMGISSHAILNFVEALEREQKDAIHSIMLRRHGKIVTKAWWAPFNSSRFISKEVAVSGAWESPDKYRVKIIYYETPHELKYTFQIDGDKILWDTEMNVSSGPISLEQLKGYALKI